MKAHIRCYTIFFSGAKGSALLWSLPTRMAVSFPGPSTPAGSRRQTGLAHSSVRQTGSRVYRRTSSRILLVPTTESLTAKSRSGIIYLISPLTPINCRHYITGVRKCKQFPSVHGLTDGARFCLAGNVFHGNPPHPGAFAVMLNTGPSMFHVFGQIFLTQRHEGNSFL